MRRAGRQANSQAGFLAMMFLREAVVNHPSDSDGARGSARAPPEAPKVSLRAGKERLPEDFGAFLVPSFGQTSSFFIGFTKYSWKDNYSKKITL